MDLWKTKARFVMDDNVRLLAANLRRRNSKVRELNRTLKNCTSQKLFGIVRKNGFY